MERIEITYKGPPAYAGRLASLLESEGATVDWKPPMERRSLDPEFAIEAVKMIVGGLTYDALKTAVRKFRERAPSADVELPPDETDD